MATFRCPNGHDSTEADFCDFCGAPIGAAGSPPAIASTDPTTDLGGTAAETSAAPMNGQTCPVCGTPRAGTDRFCENDGFDYATGKIPDTAPAQATPAAGGPPAGPAAGRAWTVTVTADRAYFDANDIDGVGFPAVCPERRFSLTGAQVLIGRRSVSQGIQPEMDLSAPPLDPGISHSHALLTRTPDGAWLLSDPGSTNGTYVNGSATPLIPGQLVVLADGDRISIGAWTTVEVHAPK